MTIDLKQCPLHGTPLAHTLWFDGKVWHEAHDKCRYCWQDTQQVTR